MKIDENTNFTNPHGLSDKHNHSTPADVCKIASLAMKNKHLKDIVSRRYYECTVVSKEFNINLLQWFNSNKLINDYASASLFEARQSQPLIQDDALYEVL